MGAAVARARSPRRRSKLPEDADELAGGGKLQEAGVHQLLVRNLHGKSITLDADLDEDISHLACAFIVHEGLQAASHLSVRFTFSGRRLEQGVPLRKYGLVRGSTVQAFACPGSRSRSPPGALLKNARRAWTDGVSTAVTPQSVPEAVVSCARGVMPSEALPEEQGSEAQWLEFPATITTPFAQVTAALEYPKRQWETCRLSPVVLRRMVRLTDVLGVQGSRDAAPADITWRLRLKSLHPFPGIQAPSFGDIWQRLQATPARVEACGGPLKETRPLVNEDDELELGSFEQEQVKGLHLSISLLQDSEVAVDDVTVMFREADRGGSPKSICIICLEPMLSGEMCRRLACLHCLHAGCAMTLLPAVPSCPVCRSSISNAPGGGPAADPPENGNDGEALPEPPA